MGCLQLCWPQLWNPNIYCELIIPFTEHFYQMVMYAFWEFECKCPFLLQLIFFFIPHLQLSSSEKPTKQNIKSITPRLSFPDVNWTKNIFNLSITDRHIHISDKLVQSLRGDTALTDLTDKAVALGEAEGRAGDSVTRKWWLEHLG